MYSSLFNGIVFAEGQPANAQIIKHVSIELNGVFSQAQLKTLDDVKKVLSSKVKGVNGNSLINFKYGQRSTFLGTLIGLDNVSWYGSGDIAIVSKADFESLQP